LILGSIRCQWQGGDEQGDEAIEWQMDRADHDHLTDGTDDVITTSLNNSKLDFR